MSNGNVIRRIDRDNGYTKIDNNIFKNKDLSLKAKGLLTMMLSFADGWEFSVSGLTSLSKDGIDSVRSGLNELEESGYLFREYPREVGKFGKTIFHLSEIPHRIGKTDTVNPYTVKPTREIQYNKELTNKELINKELNDNIYCSKEMFNDFWKNYPRKINKKKSESLYKKITEQDHELILNNIQSRLETGEWKTDSTNIKFIPHPTTYINGERWNDETIVEDDMFAGLDDYEV